MRRPYDHQDTGQGRRANATKAGPAVEAVIERIDRVMDQIEATLT